MKLVKKSTEVKEGRQEVACSTVYCQIVRLSIDIHSVSIFDNSYICLLHYFLNAQHLGPIECCDFFCFDGIVGFGNIMLSQVHSL